ncbi:bifunctional tetrahydrofolate synthase/dihydrofolate synthase [Thalassotalea mangrovi]|uniref:Dihydrofolate synthase/folylpolyglutamate synthase n=1 Tax=Thalassotalea mangrovi TaxID=2572245 RepID=A0A4U1B4A0_9GAMM|nr:bifunctional tetrahydrofolate synthase/dihydrofolate synthase [Thalassotalea mangrovi]TKB45093.1 bifunctional tetrahydrofolate synthase/dihydrofolate synthase [Thalassotalea mangrovi]
MTQTNHSHLSLTTLDEWLFYLESIHSLEIDMTLDRISEVRQRLAITLEDKTVVTVGGTNGKGTTCAFLETALLDSGYSVAVYSSPHINQFNERLRINKALINDDALIDAFRRIERARAEISLTYYEYTTLAALMICQAQDVDVVILEVGLGGRLDATNIIDADLSIITSIDLDHQQFLGNDRSSIGLEKAGICRSGKPAVIGEPNLPLKVRQYLDSLGCEGFYRGEHFDHLTDADGKDWQWRGADATFNQLGAPAIPKDNVATALMALSILNKRFTNLTIAERANNWIAATQVAGRTEVVSTDPMVMLDVAHNPHAARHLAKVVGASGVRKVHALVGMLADKDIYSTLAAMTDVVDIWYPVSLNVPRGAKAGQLIDELQKLHQSSNGFDNVSDGFKIAKQNANKNDMILVFGSFFTVADFKKSCI